MNITSLNPVKAGDSEYSIAEAPIRWIPLAIGLSVVTLLWDLFKLPQLLGFAPYAFGDPGCNLTTFYLVSHGYRPTIDFGYAYGLMGILANQAWFHAVPLKPVGYQAFSIMCQLFVVCAMARIAGVLAFRPTQVVFLFVAIGRAVMPTYFTFAHGMEAVLISSAAAEQARGARGNALALTTAAVFAKPTMGYVYSALLLTLMARDLYRRRISALAPWLERIRPAAVVGLSLCALLGLMYGLAPLWRTVLPLSGMGNYKALRNGFFTAEGSNFWHPAHSNWHYYAGTMIGLWAVATAYLIWGATPAAWRLWESPAVKSDSIGMRRDEMIVSCVLLHLAFVFFFYANSWSWIYYSWILIVGAAAVPIDKPIHRYALCALVVIAAGTYYALGVDSVSEWNSMSRTPATANLWSSAGASDEWSRVIAAIKGRRAVALHAAGAVEVLYPQFERPVGVYFEPGLMTATEIQREVTRIESADVIVVPNDVAGWGGYTLTPETERALASFKQTERGAYLSVYERR